MKQNSLLRFIQYIFLRIFLLQKPSGFQVRKFTQGLSGVRSMVILLPQDQEICSAFLDIARSLQAKNIQLTIVVHSTCRPVFSSLRAVKFFEYFPSDLGRVGIPGKSFREKMHFTEADALLSLNFSQDYFLHICALLLKCRIKIGIKGVLTDKIYQIQFSSENSVVDSFKSIQAFCHI